MNNFLKTLKKEAYFEDEFGRNNFSAKTVSSLFYKQLEYCCHCDKRLFTSDELENWICDSCREKLK